MFQQKLNVITSTFVWTHFNILILRNKDRQFIDIIYAGHCIHANIESSFNIIALKQNAQKNYIFLCFKFFYYQIRRKSSKHRIRRCSDNLSSKRLVSLLSAWSRPLPWTFKMLVSMGQKGAGWIKGRPLRGFVHLVTHAYKVGNSGVMLTTFFCIT